MEGGTGRAPNARVSSRRAARRGEAPQVPRVEAPQAPRRVEFGGVPLSTGGEVWGGGSPLPYFSKKFFWLKIVYFGVYSDSNSHFMRPIAGLKNCM